MKIVVYGKPGCGKCKSAKEKIKRLGYEYTSANIADYTEHHEGWREDGSVGIKACYEAIATLPVIQIGFSYMGYPEAMKYLKNSKPLMIEEKK